MERPPLERVQPGSGVSAEVSARRWGGWCFRPQDGICGRRSDDQNDHFYTTDESEKERAVSEFGYRAEGVMTHVWRTEGDAWVQSTPIFRTYNPDVGNHFYTTSESEKNNAVNNLGYRDEGKLGYALPGD